jgi:hypothetical protein
VVAVLADARCAPMISVLSKNPLILSNKLDQASLTACGNRGRKKPQDQTNEILD